MNTEKVLILVRGVSGSGKTTLAKTLSEGNYPVVSADDFLLLNPKYRDSEGNLILNSYILKEIHESCHKQTKIFMDQATPKIYVANTFLKESDLKPYIDLAIEMGYKYFSIVVENRHGNSNVNGVSEVKVDKMRSTLRQFIKL